MEIVFERDSEENFLEIQLTEKEIKNILSYHMIDKYTPDYDKKKRLNISIRRQDYV